MQKYFKIGILIVVLIIPVFIFLYLKTFGENHYQLPKFIPLIDSTSGKVLLKRNLKRSFNQAEFDTVFHQIPRFSLINQEGELFDSNVLKGEIYVANFFFTRCGTICPKMSSQLTRVQDVFAKDNEINFLSISIDPKNDRPEELKNYAKEYDAINDKWHFLTGEKSYIYPLALKGFYLPVSDASVYNEAIKNPDEAFIHSEKLVLVDKDGFIRGFYDGTDKKDVDRLILEIKVLISIYQTEK